MYDEQYGRQSVAPGKSMGRGRERERERERDGT
jgi:hypothetical protein